VPLMSLRDAIEESIRTAPGTYGSEAWITLSMHDAEGPVLYGIARPQFIPDLALRGTTGPVTIGGGSSSTTGIGHWFTRQPTPGYSTRGVTGYYPNTNYYLSSGTAGTYPFQPFNTNQKTQMDFSIRRDPGIPILQWLRGGPSVQIEIEAGANAVTLNADEDGLYLRAVGPSIENPSHRAIYTVTLDWMPIIP
jgi:hypothetical protein